MEVKEEVKMEVKGEFKMDNIIKADSTQSYRPASLQA